MDRQITPSKSDRWWDIPAAVLLLIILTTAFTRLTATEWTGGLQVTRTITYLGLVAGLALGQSRFSARLATVFAILYGVFVVPWRLGLLLGEGVLWTERLLSMGGRLSTILVQLVRRQAVTDSFLFLVLMGTLFWFLSIYAGYSLTRYANPWRVALPVGVALVLVHSYDSYFASRIWYLVIYLFFALLLVARLVYLHNRNRWQSTNTYIPPYLGVDFVRLALIATLVLLLLTWTTPALADAIPAAQEVWQKLKQPWNDIRNTMDNAFASLRSTVGIVSDYYGPNLSLGRGNRLTDTQVFTVLVPEERVDNMRYYWRARVYDSYENGWRSTLLSTEILDAETFDLRYPDSADNAPGQYSFSFNLSSPLATLLAPSQLVWVSRPVKLELEFNENGEADLGSLRATPPLRAGETYHIRSSFNQPTIKSLREAGTEYPDWVTERYLQLPETITPRTIQLAQSIAAGNNTQYDIVMAVTNYLRQNIEYSETVPALPTDQDLVDWFLFDLKQGFCNYYASAEIILLRALGIPARLAVGYAQGEPLEVANAYMVRQRDAHAWPEIYFQGIGWVEFEPTVSQPSLLRPQGEELENPVAIPTPNILGPNDEENFDPSTLADTGTPEGIETLPWAAISIGAAIAGLLVVLALLLVPLARRRRWHEKLPMLPVMLETGIRKFGIQPPKLLVNWSLRARLSPLSRAYQEINFALDRLGSTPSPTDTPSERVSGLTAVLPLAGPPAGRLVEEYQTTIYSRNYSPDVPTAKQAGSEIRQLSYRAWLQKLFNPPRKNRF